MDKIELRDKLNSLGVPSSLYSLEGGFPNEKLCLAYEGGSWFVYYSERGVKTDLKKFTNENDACVDIFNKIKSIVDGVVR
ncbi:hypothetical protein KD5_03530 [Yersinia pseudotuberculosis]|uniref:Uncharacterized protein n=1 Tax=Yersinia pseudotuberculosis TaxID=633 RepID=A0ABM7AGW8_YERPU|nr:MULTISPECIES: hypothetical protein [Yersinia pseudotuberculosis complex]AYW91610.1 hypothetical protein EGX47_09960 [Yersinia pseudotuberculosis]AYW95931.1 hypothetical protein EGX39_08885 [Yersinia pseudotuberculosis]MBO1629685.1 hypothetical protein [Yersinia pseudotuberculosis]MBP0071081.1 hypothetical protein [Yersinia pseudotuberculosis]CNC64658.1 Uncharacterised protein [Yersinia similis]